MDLALGLARARNFEPGDDLYELLPEYSYLMPDPKLTWVVENGWGRICGVLLTTYGSQICCLLRLASSWDAPHGWLVTLLRRVIADLDDRGCRVIMVSMSAIRPEEKKLLRLLKRAGGEVAPLAGYVGIVPVALARRW